MEKVACRTPAEGRDGVTNIPAWKFECLRKAILDQLAAGDIAFADLREAVRARLTRQELDDLGSLGWHMTAVKLELEVRGEVRRLKGVSPQMLTLGEPQ